MKRYLDSYVATDLKKKMVFLSGPRQAGKTHLAMTLLKKPEANGAYFNWDLDEHKELILNKEFPSQGLLVFDELHKYVKWRNYLKGVFDVYRDRFQILLTGSAKLDFYRRGGDSLQGRYNSFRLFPLSFAEVHGSKQKDVETFLELGPFPEPFLSQDATQARKWSRQYRSRVVQEELLSLEKVSKVSLVQELAMRFSDVIGSPLSINALREDLGVGFPTAKRWVDIFEQLYLVFRIYPFGAPRLRAIKKEPKLYLFDWTSIQDKGARLENLVAFHLLKWCAFIEDTQGYSMELRYFRDKDQREVDFIVVRDKKPELAIEVKVSDKSISKDLIYFKKKFPEVRAIQAILDLKEEKLHAEHGILLMPIHKLLSEWI